MCKRIIVILVFLLCTICVSHLDVNASMKQGDKEITYIYFGNYWQTDAEKKEPIEWELEGITNNIACLHSAKCLEYMIYDDVWSSKSTWATSKCRKWLNNTFLYDAFDTNERNLLKKVSLSLYRDQDLSTVNLSGYFHGVPVKATNYAMRRYPGASPYIWWISDGWIQSEGRRYAYAGYDGEAFPGQYVGYTKSQEKSTLIIRNELFGIRPCIFIDISKACWKVSRYKKINTETDKTEYYKIEYADEHDEIGVETNDTEYSNREDADTTEIRGHFIKYKIKKPGIVSAKRTKNKAVIQWKKTDDSTSYDLWYSTTKKFTKKKT
ncbi:DUF6273 domain-containing protein, partial [Eubacterium xylanophilum]|uniref:DUF6273 domain-containing protein n=1 Tax=Eubacterium xylanophilum TaxID=39497 RepID=UPI00054ED965